MSSKAHTATVNRIARRYGVVPVESDAFDIQSPEFIIEVETSASLDAAVEKLKTRATPVYIAVTNMEGVQLALRRTESTQIGVMDPQGNVVRASGDHPPPRPAT
jgi:hypothetical protein